MKIYKSILLSVFLTLSLTSISNASQCINSKMPNDDLLWEFCMTSTGFEVTFKNSVIQSYTYNDFKLLLSKKALDSWKALSLDEKDLKDALVEFRVFPGNYNPYSSLVTRPSFDIVVHTQKGSIMFNGSLDISSNDLVFTNNIIKIPSVNVLIGSSVKPGVLIVGFNDIVTDTEALTRLKPYGIQKVTKVIDRVTSSSAYVECPLFEEEKIAGEMTKNAATIKEFKFAEASFYSGRNKSLLSQFKYVQ